MCPPNTLQIFSECFMMGVGQPAKNLSPLIISPNFLYLPKSIEKASPFIPPFIYLLNYFIFGHNSPPFYLICSRWAQILTPLISPICPYMPNWLRFCHLLVPKFPGSNSSYHPIRFKICILVGTHYWMETGRKPVSGFVHVQLFCSFEFFVDTIPKKIPIVHTFWKSEFLSFAFAFGSYGTRSLVSRLRVLGRIPIQLTLSSCK
jgi:hypothetical protein